MKVLQLIVHFLSNIGGVETHLNDLVNYLTKENYDIFVLCYRPLVAKTKWKLYEKINKLRIFRVLWVPGLFYKFIKNPLLEFLYLFPGLFITTPFVIFFFNPDVIQAHGLVAGFVGTFWGKIFGKRIINTTHSIYNFPQTGLYHNFARWIFKNSNIVLTLSKQSKNEISSLGIEDNKIMVFTYWIDLNQFKPIRDAKRIVGWKNKFVVLFVGRLVEEKGILVAIEAVRKWNKNIHLAIAGTGPLNDEIKNLESEILNLIYLGKMDQEQLPIYYSASDLVIVPSIHEEGFGRVILESLACGKPVIASNRGAIPEAIDNTVGKLINMSIGNIRKEIEYYYSNPSALRVLSRTVRQYAEKRYSEKNARIIIDCYK